MATAVTQYLKINQERDQEINAISPQASQAETQTKVNQIQNEREQKIQAMRTIVKTNIEPLFTDAQRASLGLSPAAALAK